VFKIEILEFLILLRSFSLIERTSNTASKERAKGQGIQRAKLGLTLAAWLFAWSVRVKKETYRFVYRTNVGTTSTSFTNVLTIPSN